MSSSTDQQPEKLTISSDAIIFFNQSVEAANRGDNNSAYQLTLAALAEDPNLAGAWQNLGIHLHQRKQFGAAVGAYYRALQLAPDNLLMRGGYAWNLHCSRRNEEALEVMKSVLELDLRTAQHWVNISQIYLSLNQIPDGLRCAESAFNLDANNPEAKLAMALAQLRSKDYVNGLMNFEARLPYIPVLREFLNYPYPMWRGQDISQGRLFIAAEQGLGDSIMFLRFIPLAAKRCRKLIILVHDNALVLFRRNLKHLPNVEIHPLPHELPAADAFIPLLGLPTALGLSNDEITNSYMELRTPDSPWPLPVTKSYTKGIPHKVKNIGIAWAGDPAHDHDKLRSAPLEAFLPLLEIPHTQLYSLQIGNHAADLDNNATHAMIRSVSPYLKTAADTAAFIKHELDAVVTVDTAVAHMAGSVGVPTFIILGHGAIDWRWGNGTGTPAWYPSAELILQDSPGDWRSCMDKVTQKIISL